MLRIKFFGIFCIAWLMSTGSILANPVRKTINVDGFEREYLVYTPQHTHKEKPEGIIVCLHGFGRSMNDFFGEYNVSPIADSLNMLIIAPQALPEQSQRVNLVAATISSLTDNRISLHAVWGCGLSIRANLLLLGTSLLNEELNKDVDDVTFIDRMINEVQADNSLTAENVFILGTSMGGFMAYQYALIKGARLSGLIAIAGSMGLNIKGMDNKIKLPICDFHSVADEVIPYTGSQIQYLSVISLAKPKAEVINYWAGINSTGKPVTEQVRYFPSTNGRTVEKITYPDPVYEVVHYKIDGASHSYFFKKEAGDCMDHVEEIARFIRSHRSTDTYNSPIVAKRQSFFYPNPVVDKIYFNTNSGILSIYDITGRKIFNQSFTAGHIDLTFLKSGIYVIEIQSGNTIQTGKFFKR